MKLRNEGQIVNFSLNIYLNFIFKKFSILVQKYVNFDYFEIFELNFEKIELNFEKFEFNFE